jgi:hypothetical protein
MLEMAYEPILEKFVQEKDLEKAVIDFKQYLIDQAMTIFDCNVNVFIGGDTRPSTPELLELVAKGIQYAKGTAVNFGLTTTPQLQYYGTFTLTFSLLIQHSNKAQKCGKGDSRSIRTQSLLLEKLQLLLQAMHEISQQYISEESLS